VRRRRPEPSRVGRRTARDHGFFIGDWETGSVMRVLSCRWSVETPALAGPPFGSRCARKPAAVRFKAASRRLAAGPSDLAKAGPRAARGWKAPVARKPASLDSVRPGP
jgi:hypothetical protein